MSNSDKYQISININLLTLLFIGLKLTHYIDWSWWWVLAPSWIPFALFIIFMVLWVILNIFSKR